MTDNAQLPTPNSQGERPVRFSVLGAGRWRLGVDAVLLVALAIVASAGLLAAQRAREDVSQDVIRVRLTAPDGRSRIESVPLDEYVARVLAGEGQPRAADAAQQALAVAIRTYAAANRNRHGRDGFDMCDTTHCQVLRAATQASTRASLATSGRVLVHQRQPASVFYSAWCGGHSELASEVWPGAIDYGRGRGDDACEGEARWTSEMAVDEIEAALRAAGRSGAGLRELRVVRRNASGRAAVLHADGFTPAEISGQDFRMAVGRVAGPLRLKSTAFELRRTPRGYAFTGRGFGHGVGLCVVGAGRRAAAGASANEILAFYYPALQVEPLSRVVR